MCGSAQVSLFLTEGIQDHTSQFFLKSQAGAKGEVGSVVQCGDSSRRETQTKVDLAFMHENPNEWYCHPCELGINLYACAPRLSSSCRRPCLPMGNPPAHTCPDHLPNKSRHLP